MSAVIANWQVNGASPVVIGGANAVQFFPRPLGPSIGVAPLTPSTTNNQGCLIVPGQNALNGQFFTVNIAGNYTTPGGTVTVALVASQVLPGVSPSYTVLGGTAAVTPSTSVLTPFGLKFTLFGDTGSGIVSGTYAGYANGALSVTGGTTAKIVDANLTGVNFNAGIGGSNGAPFVLGVRVTFGTPAAANAATLYQFTIEA